MFGPKIVFFYTIDCCDHYALIITWLLHKLILLFLRFEFAQDSKNFQKMDIDDVQKSIWRNPFGKFDAALGILRNFFGAIIGRPCLVSCLVDGSLLTNPCCDLNEPKLVYYHQLNIFYTNYFHHIDETQDNVFF